MTFGMLQRLVQRLAPAALASAMLVLAVAFAALGVVGVGA